MEEGDSDWLKRLLVSAGFFVIILQLPDSLHKRQGSATRRCPASYPRRRLDQHYKRTVPSEHAWERPIGGRQYTDNNRRLMKCLLVPGLSNVLERGDAFTVTVSKVEKEFMQSVPDHEVAANASQPYLPRG